MLKALYFIITVSFCLKMVRSTWKELYFCIQVSNKEGSKTNKHIDQSLPSGVITAILIGARAVRTPSYSLPCAS